MATRHREIYVEKPRCAAQNTAGISTEFSAEKDFCTSTEDINMGSKHSARSSSALEERAPVISSWSSTTPTARTRATSSARRSSRPPRRQLHGGEGKGLICTPMSEQVAKHLGLEQMVKVNTDKPTHRLHGLHRHVDTTTAFPQRSAASPAASASTRTPSRRICAVRVTYSRSSRAAAAC